MESLFARQKTQERHMAAPLLKEREDFLAHLLNQGCSLQRLRSLAALVNTVLRVLEVTSLREIKIAEIENAASRWANNGLPHGSRLAGPSSEGTFIYVAKKWFRFHGMMPVLSITEPGETLIEDFAIAMKQRFGLASASIRSYRSRAALFVKWLIAERKKTLSELCLTDVDAYLDSKRNAGWKARTLAAQCQAMRTFLRYAESQGWCSAGIAKGIKSPTLPKVHAVPQGPPWSDVRRMLIPVSDKPSELRASAILSFFALYGLRSSEVANLRLEDFDWLNETFVVRRAKRGRVQHFRSSMR